MWVLNLLDEAAYIPQFKKKILSTKYKWQNSKFSWVFWCGHLSSESVGWRRGDPAVSAICGSCCDAKSHSTISSSTRYRLQNTAKIRQNQYFHMMLLGALWHVYCCSVQSLVLGYILWSLIQYIGLHLKRLNAVERGDVQREVYGGDIPCKVGSTDFHIVTNLWQTR